MELGVGIWNKTQQAFTCKQAKHSKICSTDSLTLMDWEKLQPADSLQTAQDYAWNSGWFYTVVPLAAAWHLFKIKTTKKDKKKLVLLLIVLNEILIIPMTSENVCTFLPENARISGQHGLQQHRCISLRFIAAQVVLEFSGKHTGALSSYKNVRGVATTVN